MSNAKKIKKNQQISSNDILFIRTLSQGLHSRNYKYLLNKKAKRQINERSHLKKKYFY